MQNLTTKELSSIQGFLTFLQLDITKLEFYSEKIEDSEIQTACTNLATKHKGHYNKILSFLG